MVNKKVESQQSNQLTIHTLNDIDPKAVAKAREATLKAQLGAPKAQGGHGLAASEVDEAFAQLPEKRKMDQNEPLVRSFEHYLDAGRIAVALDLPAELDSCVGAMGK